MVSLVILLALGLGSYLLGYLVGRQGNPRQPREDLHPDALRQCLKAAQDNLQEHIAGAWYNLAKEDETAIKQYRKRLRRAERNATTITPAPYHTDNNPWPY